MSYLIGVDLGGTNIAVGILTTDGNIVCSGSVPTLRGRPYELIVKDMAQLINSVMKEEEIELSEIIGIGIGSPGVVDTRTKSIVFSCNLFNNAPLCDELEKYYKLPIYIENDANCAALGESKCGAAINTYSCLTVTIGTGIGGGIVLDGKIFSGFNFAGGEIGHHVIKVDGEQCTCGRKGCWEAYSSATALIRDAKKATLLNPNSIINELCNNDIDKIDAKIVFDAYHRKDHTAMLVLDEYFNNLSIGLVNMINIFQPEVLVISGGICNQEEHLLAPLREHINREVYTRDFTELGLPQTKLKIATLGNNAGIVGAAMLAMK